MIPVLSCMIVIAIIILNRFLYPSLKENYYIIMDTDQT